MPPFFPLHVRTEPNGLGNVLSCTQALGLFSQFELALLAPLEVLPVRVFSVCVFLWRTLLPKLKMLSEIGKTSVESVCGTSVGGQPSLKACSSNQERKTPLMTA